MSSSSVISASITRVETQPYVGLGRTHVVPVHEIWIPDPFNICMNNGEDGKTLYVFSSTRPRGTTLSSVSIPLSVAEQAQVYITAKGVLTESVRTLIGKPKTAADELLDAMNSRESDRRLLAEEIHMPPESDASGVTPASPIKTRGAFSFSHTQSDNLEDSIQRPLPNPRHEEFHLLVHHIFQGSKLSLSELRRVQSYIMDHAQNVPWDAVVRCRVPRDALADVKEGAIVEGGRCFLWASASKPTAEEQGCVRVLRGGHRAMPLGVDRWVWDARYQLTYKADGEGLVHKGRYSGRSCDCCADGTPIRGAVYGCRQCANFDLCSLCMRSGEHGHDAEHDLFSRLGAKTEEKE